MSENSKLAIAVAPTANSLNQTTLFGPPTLLEGEDTAAYDELVTHVSSAVKPSDILEEFWVRDVVDLVWDIFRMRRLKTNLLRVNAHKGLAVVLEPLTNFVTVDVLRKAWASRDKNGIKEVNKLLASAGLTIDAVMAQTLAINIDNIERIDRMIMMAETRRNTALHEIERHRASLGLALRRATQDVEDAEYKVIESIKSKSVGHKKAA